MIDYWAATSKMNLDETKSVEYLIDLKENAAFIFISIKFYNQRFVY